jgi:hypothetical protein
MRKAINENPVVQMAVVGVLLAVAAIFLLMRSGGSSSSPDGQAASSPAVSSGASAPASATPPVSPSGGTSLPSSPASQPSPAGLPHRVLASYRSNDVVVLLVVRKGGIDDARVRSAVERLNGEPGVAVFVTDSDHIARFASITEGVSVDRTPALVVIKPPSVGGAGAPQASVSYGFLSAQSIDQAVRDALYKGPERSYDP